MRIQAMFAALLMGSSLLLAQIGPRGARPGAARSFGFKTGKVVTGQPYSADVNNTSIKTLPDGNTIQRTTSGHVARDSQGRTYSQETITGLFGQTGLKTITFLSDPVAGYVYTLNAETKTATRRPFHERTGQGGKSASSVGTSRPPNPNVVSSDLGTQLVNGVNAQGKKVTHTIPAGEMGNAQPIVSTSETWFAKDLQVIVSAKRIDPREGVSNYTLNNIQLSEPPAALFQVPPDYTIKDAPSFERGGFGGFR